MCLLKSGNLKLFFFATELFLNFFILGLPFIRPHIMCYKTDNIVSTEIR